VLPIGGIEAVPVNVRVIAATHRDLAALVRDGAFRQDLYYRLNILRIEMPPLRDRAGPARAGALLYRRAQERLGMSRRNRCRIVRARLARYAWPGNIRELENVTERIAVLVAGAQLDAAALQREVQAGAGIVRRYAGRRASGHRPRRRPTLAGGSGARHRGRAYQACAGRMRRQPCRGLRATWHQRDDAVASPARRLIFRCACVATVGAHIPIFLVL
jgi:propionate catabolism operon transcriptional regulator